MTKAGLTVLGGALIGLLCGIWTFVMGFTGWYKHPTLLYAFFLVILIEIGVLVWGLRKTAGLGSRYWSQVALGTAMAAIGGAILIFTSLLFTGLVFPEYFSELRTMQAEILRGQGRSEAEIAAEIAKAAESQTPLINALQGFVGTVITGLIASLIIAASVRRK